MIITAALLVAAALNSPRFSPAEDPTVMRIAVARAETLQVTVTGRGNPIVIVPGIWSNTFAFRKVVPRLVERSLQVIIIEPLGVASSGRPKDSDYSMTAQSRRIAAVLDSLRIRRAVFVGQALSGSMIMRMSLESPERVAAIVSLEGGAAEISATPGLKTGLAVSAILLRIIPASGLIRRRLFKDLRNVSGDKSWITDDVVEGYMVPWRKSIQATIRAYRAIASSVEPAPLAPRLKDLKMPVRVMIGAAPHYGGVGEEEMGPMKQLMPQLEMQSVPGAGHLLHEERPDVVAASILDMVQRTARTTGAIMRPTARQRLVRRSTGSEHRAAAGIRSADHGDARGD